jgi:hypothetical protein
VFRPRDAPLFLKLRQVETLKNCICANILREGEEIAFESAGQHSHHPHEHRPAELFEPCPLWRKRGQQVLASPRVLARTRSIRIIRWTNRDPARTVTKNDGKLLRSPSRPFPANEAPSPLLITHSPHPANASLGRQWRWITSAPPTILLTERD